jgi:hypothetical protein
MAVTDMITKKAARRIYSVRLLKRAGVADTDLVTFYSTCVRTVLEYACPAWFYSTTEYLREQIESIQRRIMRIIFPDTSYRDALYLAGIPRLCVRLENLCDMFFSNIMKQNHKLYDLVPPTYQTIITLGLRPLEYNSSCQHIKLIDLETILLSNLL